MSYHWTKREVERWLNYDPVTDRFSWKPRKISDFPSEHGYMVWTQAQFPREPMPRGSAQCMIFGRPLKRDRAVRLLTTTSHDRPRLTLSTFTAAIKSRMPDVLDDEILMMYRLLEPTIDRHDFGDYLRILWHIAALDTTHRETVCREILAMMRVAPGKDAPTPEDLARHQRRSVL